jgi:hypothetical protein
MFCRWQQLRSSYLDDQYLLNRIDSLVNYMGPAIDRNFERFDILGAYMWPNSFVGETHEQEVEFLKDWLFQRIFWMDMNITANPSVDCGEILDRNEAELPDLLDAYPNPFRGQVTFKFNQEMEPHGELLIYDVLGNVKARFKPQIQPITVLGSEPPGVYIYEYRAGKSLLTRGKIVKSR